MSLDKARFLGQFQRKIWTDGYLSAFSWALRYAIGIKGVLVVVYLGTAYYGMRYILSQATYIQNTFQGSVRMDMLTATQEHWLALGFVVLLIALRIVSNGIAEREADD